MHVFLSAWVYVYADNTAKRIPRLTEIPFSIIAKTERSKAVIHWALVEPQRNEIHPIEIRTWAFLETRTAPKIDDGKNWHFHVVGLGDFEPEHLMVQTQKSCQYLVSYLWESVCSFRVIKQKQMNGPTSRNKNLRKILIWQIDIDLRGCTRRSCIPQIIHWPCRTNFYREVSPLGSCGKFKTSVKQ